MNTAKWIFCTMLFLMVALGMLSAQMPVGWNRPTSVPSEYVITPFGYFDPRCVHEIKQGEILLGDGRIRFADGTEETTVSFCSFPRYSPSGELVVEGSPEPLEISWSWIEAGQVSASTNYGKVMATWTVPPTPTTNHGQTLFFFPGFAHVKTNPPNEEPIIQPVLGWNDGQQGVGPWNIASWDCCPSGQTFYSTPLTVTPGDKILGTVKSTCKAGSQSCSKWNITTKDVTIAQSTTLSTDYSQPLSFPWALAGVLEVYSIYQCSDYPPNHSTKFSNVALWDDNFKRITNPGWGGMLLVEKGSTTPWCNYGVKTTPTSATLAY